MGVKYFQMVSYWMGAAAHTVSLEPFTDNEDEVRMSKDLEYHHFGRVSLFFCFIFCVFLVVRSAGRLFFRSVFSRSFDTNNNQSGL